MKKAIAVFSVLVTVFAILLSRQVGHFLAAADVSYDTEDNDYEYVYNETSQETEEVSKAKAKGTSSDKEKMIRVETDPDNIAVLVNRQYPMSSDYVPDDLVVPNIRFSFYGTYEKSYVRQVTADALEELFQSAAQKGIILKGVSGYRSYERQQQIYSNNVKTRGEEETNLVSAQPGSSEHQTGLAIDVSSDSVGCALEESFGATEEGQWLAKNCHKFGFIIRYPEDKTSITGYSYEPWHIRYVGEELASYLYKKDWTLEEYYQKTTKADMIVQQNTQINDTEGVDDIDEPEMTAAPTPKPTVKEEDAKASAEPTSTPKETKKPKASKKPKATKKPVSTKKPVKKPATPAPTEQATASSPPVSETPAVSEEPSATATAETTDGVETGNSISTENAGGVTE